MYLKLLNFQFSFLILIISALLFGACTDDVQIRKSALHYFEEGNSALKKRDFQMAIWNYQKAINLDSESPNFYYNLGLTYFEIGNYVESIRSFKRVEKLVPNQTDTYYNLALAHYKMSDSRMADIYYNRYQEMLSLRKAQERLDKVKKEQEKKPKISEAVSKTKVYKKGPASQKKQSNRNKRDKNNKLNVPNWEK